MPSYKLICVLIVFMIKIVSSADPTDIGMASNSTTSSADMTPSPANASTPSPADMTPSSADTSTGSSAVTTPNSTDTNIVTTSMTMETSIITVVVSTTETDISTSTTTAATTTETDTATETITAATTLITITATSTATISAPLVSTTSLLQPVRSKFKCLDVRGAIFQNGTPVQIFDCNGTPAQNWVIARGRGRVQLAGTNFCLDAGSSPANGVGMKIWQCFDNLQAQDWFNTLDDRIALTNQGLCLDLTDGKLTNSNRVQTWKCTDNDINQVWFAD